MAFTFASYRFDQSSGELALSYTFGEHAFTERLIFPVEGVRFDAVDQAALQRCFFALHLAGGMSYWKAHASTEPFQVLSGELDAAGATYWSEQYRLGMSEFFFRNAIDWRACAFFLASTGTPMRSSVGSRRDAQASGPATREECMGVPAHPSPSFLVPIGGGKDSTVTALALQEAGYTFTAFAVNTAPAIAATIQELGVPSREVKRIIDPALIALNKEPGTLNGHVPISLFWSYTALVDAVLHGNTDVLFSWEASASEGNTAHLGQAVNHQYSKSLACERALQAFITSHITPDVRVWSPLRPLTEFAIMGLFVRAPRFFPVFTSCNRNFTAKQLAEGTASFWCGSCAKCAFVFPLLAAWTSHGTACDVFKKDLFADPALVPTFAALCGVEGDKPFECVGEAEETAVAFAIIASRGEALASPAMEWFTRTIGPELSSTWRARAAALCTARPDHAVPPGFEHLIPTAPIVPA